MGAALENIDHLLQMPFGCGEQNMVKFVPNIVVLQYLEETNQVTPELRNRAIEHMKSGELGLFLPVSYLEGLLGEVRLCKYQVASRDQIKLGPSLPSYDHPSLYQSFLVNVKCFLHFYIWEVIFMSEDDACGVKLKSASRVT